MPLVYGEADAVLSLEGVSLLLPAAAFTNIETTAPAGRGCRRACRGAVLSAATAARRRRRRHASARRRGRGQVARQESAMRMTDRLASSSSVRSGWASSLDSICRRVRTVAIIVAFVGARSTTGTRSRTRSTSEVARAATSASAYNYQPNTTTPASPTLATRSSRTRGRGRALRPDDRVHLPPPLRRRTRTCQLHRPLPAYTGAWASSSASSARATSPPGGATRC